ncbi:MAG: GNAT family N-acetyltransferase [Hyphomonadaceae bacterium]
MIPVPTLTAAGLVLRQLQAEDGVALFAAHGDAVTHQFWSSPAHVSPDETVAYTQATLDMPGARAWAITEDGGEALGRVALFALREGVGEFGIILRREAQGRGYAAKAVELIAAHAFEELGMHRLVADVDPDNSASLTLFLRNGFQREGVLRGNWKTHLGVRDSVMLGKLKEPT